MQLRIVLWDQLIVPQIYIPTEKIIDHILKHQQMIALWAVIKILKSKILTINTEEIISNISNHILNLKFIFKRQSGYE
jgi:hypothetical protein